MVYVNIVFHVYQGSEFQLWFLVRINRFLPKKRIALSLVLKEQIAIFTLFKRVRKSDEERFTFCFVFNKSKSKNCDINKSSFQSSLKKGAKPTLKKSESLFRSKR